MPRTEVGTRLGVIWVYPDERSLRRLAHHLAQPGGFLVTGTSDRYVQAAHLHHGELVLEYRDTTHRQTCVADTQEVLDAFAEFWAGSTAFLDSHQWGPVLDTSAPAPTPSEHGSANELIASAVVARLIPLGFTVSRNKLRYRHRFTGGDQDVEFWLSRPRARPGTYRIVSRVGVGLTEVDDQVASWQGGRRHSAHGGHFPLMTARSIR